MVDAQTKNKQQRLDLSGKRKERAEYFERKRKLEEMEKGNLERLIFMRGTSGFWISAWHSAVMLANKFGPATKIRVPLKTDTDFDVVSKEGKISVKNLGFYKKTLLESELVELESETEEFCIFKLKKKVSKKEYELLAESKELRRKQLEKDILKTIPMPASHAAITKAVNIAFKVYAKHSDKNAREIFGVKAMDELRQAQKTFLLTCAGELPLECGLVKTKTALNYALITFTQMLDLGLLPVDDAGAISAAIIETKLAMDKEEREAKEFSEKVEKIKAGE